MLSPSLRTLSPDRIALARQLLADPALFSRALIRRPRAYQVEPLRAICASALAHDGRSFVVMFPRQAGKNETSALAECYLLNRCRLRGGQIVKAAPSFVPQIVNSMLRLTQTLSNPWNARRWTTRLGYIIELGLARAFFFSAHPEANVVGATASALLEADEAQDIDPAHWRKTFVPMAASTNATQVYYGTSWTSDTLLAQERRAAEEAERADGLRRVFVYTWEQVAAEVPAYGDFVRQQIKALGENHPIIRTQYKLETIDAEASLFTPQRLALMRGDHPHRHSPEPGHLYAFLLDVAGESDPATDRVGTEPERRRDSTVLTILDLDFATLPTLGAPTYRAVGRRQWVGEKHPALYAELLGLARLWHARHLVIDATGVGAGLAGFLSRALGEETVTAVEFSPRVKSATGYGYLSVIETGRYREHLASSETPLQDEFFRQCAKTRYAIHPGPGQLMSWSASPHDDLVMSAALCTHLDALPWRQDTSSYLIPGPDPLKGTR